MNRIAEAIEMTKGIAIGDALGSTSEFMDMRGVIEVYSEAGARGVNWPFAECGSKVHQWEQRGDR
ncbi:hypothetical protein [Methanothrix sp.]|uniref:hypothetical protein n=1 Tax=Methanothrix sp. TaxID=90426 RepID=UPI003C78D5C8